MRKTGKKKVMDEEEGIYEVDKMKIFGTSSHYNFVISFFLRTQKNFFIFKIFDEIFVTTKESHVSIDLLKLVKYQIFNLKIAYSIILWFTLRFLE